MWQRSQPEKKIQDLDIKLFVCTSEKKEEKNIKDLIEEARKQNKNIIFTFTPGPFKTSEELPVGWMDSNEAKGCTPQLNAFDQALAEAQFSENTIVYAVNQHPAEYLTGPDGLLAKKNWHKLNMISDPEGKLIKLLNLETFNLPNNQKQYPKRGSVMITLKEEAFNFEFKKPVDDEKAKEHLANIKSEMTLVKDAKFTSVMNQ